MLARPLIFGEVLYDCFPDGEQVLGGAPFNVAWHCQAYGMQPFFVSRVGDDAKGQAIAKAMRKWGMDVSGVQFDPVHPTGIVEVSLNDGEPAYDIVENSAWDFIEPQQVVTSSDVSMLYHGSLALRQPVSASALRTIQANIKAPVFIDVNLRSPWWSQALALRIIEKGKWIKLNADELSLLVPQFDTIETRVQYLLTKYEVELIIVTQGEAGAIAVSRDETCTIKPEKVDIVIDTVGAGDAFCSVLLLGLHHKWPLSTILKRAQQFASAVVGQRGATTQDKSFYDRFIANWQL